MSERYVFTPGGLRRLYRRIADSRAAYQAIADDNPEALESGDTSGWHDNFAFEENQRQMHQLARRVRDLERIQALAEEVPVHLEAPPRAFLGAAVTWCYLDEPDVERLVWIGGYDDGAPERGRISYNSPLGAALVGAREGEEREVLVADRQRRIEVLEIGPTPVGGDDDDQVNS
ncbi:MAG: hypothetical protein GY913_07065 [Proteobacteria bacterium]|nr:hypothetical protein [Pseudomonadota bacterium]MCP4916668.1 hypothetical protein [Pseudomonadota bacterium]